MIRFEKLQTKERLTFTPIFRKKNQNKPFLIREKSPEDLVFTPNSPYLLAFPFIDPSACIHFPPRDSRLAIAAINAGSTPETQTQNKN